MLNLHIQVRWASFLQALQCLHPHKASAAQAAKTFRIGVLEFDGATFDITLPYQAFNLKASFLFSPNAVKYFPIRRVANGTQYTLGRNFPSESYSSSVARGPTSLSAKPFFLTRFRSSSWEYNLSIKVPTPPYRNRLLPPHSMGHKALARRGAGAANVLILMIAPTIFCVSDSRPCY